MVSASGSGLTSAFTPENSARSLKRVLMAATELEKIRSASIVSASRLTWFCRPTVRMTFEARSFAARTRPAAPIAWHR